MSRHYWKSVFYCMDILLLNKSYITIQYSTVEYGLVDKVHYTHTCSPDSIPGAGKKKRWLAPANRQDKLLKWVACTIVSKNPLRR